MFYPKLLPWKAKKAHVPEPFARALWANNMLIATATGTEKQYKLLNEQFDTQLAVVGVGYTYARTTYNTIQQTITAFLQPFIEEKQHV